LPTGRYADFAIAQRERVRGAVLEREMAYWKSYDGHRHAHRKSIDA
jgi:hypothetical protein